MGASAEKRAATNQPEKFMAAKTLNDLFVHALSDVYSAEKQLTKALPKLARAATNPELAAAFKTHLEETQGQIERIDQVVENTDIKLKRVKCVAMEGLVEEGQEQIEEIEQGPILDAALIAAAQKVEHYEIATYGTLAALAKKLGYTDAMNLLLETLKEEKATDEKLTLLAEQQVSEEEAGTPAVKQAGKRSVN
jgi:ferritin-like metal-binding protein YciE